MSEIRIEIRKIPIFAITILLLLVGLSSASAVGSGPLTTTTVQTFSGVIFRIAGGFTVIATSFTPEVTTSPTATNPCTWTAAAPLPPFPGDVCTTTTTAGNWALQVDLQLKSGLLPGTYTILESAIPMGAIPMSFSVPATAIANSIMRFVFDLATTTLPGTTVILVIVS